MFSSLSEQLFTLPRAGLSARSIPGVVGHCYACTYRSAAGRGGIMVTIGTAIALWCVLTFVFIGKGTPAPFDPPRKLVIRGPYRFVRNPMYIGAGMTLAGTALFYESLSIFIYCGLFFLITHLFVVLYEEPTLRRTFGDDYEAYFRRVKRWQPGHKRR
ncbi:MAG: isoprenylcysteine carboxyl methyltransferase [Verrucomicrobia bacterium]|nr:MAG: isoprenylcysteine carboxyl methyltransferase [Verrucomicrobiota bacterium]